MPNEETIKQAITRMQGIDLNEFVQLIQDEINKRAFLKALEFVKPDNGVKIWVGWDNYAESCGIFVFREEPQPKEVETGGTMFTGAVCSSVPNSFARDILKLEPGQCRPFLITEVQDGV